MSVCDGDGAEQIWVYRVVGSLTKVVTTGRLAALKLCGFSVAMQKRRDITVCNTAILTSIVTLPL